jgi:diguanylate cyclase
MQPATTPPEQTAGDIATRVVTTMRQMGVLSLPRNYEIFYEALNGTNPDLSLAVIALGNRPTQDALDRIGRKFFAHTHGDGIVEHARDVLARELEDVAALLRSEQCHVEKYGRILDETTGGLNGRSLISQELLRKIVGAISVATNSTIDHGRQVATTLGDKSTELENVKAKLEEYKRLADTDALTRIWNRRAFEKQLARIYDSRKGVLFSALILADIDRFKSVNDRFGHPVGDRIIRTVADIFRTSIRADMFVARTGGEEFALIVEGVSEDSTYGIAERIRTLVAQTPFTNSQTGANYGTVTISMGICMASEAEGPEDLYARADRALYRSKVSGRNRVTRHAALPGNMSKNWLLYKGE